MKGIKIHENKIYINGKAEKIMAGAIHYFRVPPDYWRDRLVKLKEMGCNCVETYVCWNIHEKREGEFDFSGWLDFGKFLDMAAEEGLYAIVRPGPYICSEWDFGGMPWWILKYPDIELRCMHPLFLEKIAPYLDRVCKLLRPRLIGAGGNIIFVQIENEYGSFGNDQKYLLWLKEFYENRGIDCGLLTSDGETEFLLRGGTLPNVLASVNYRWDSVRCLASLQKYHGGQPGAVLELWNGKAQHWGEEVVRRDIGEVAESVRTALENAELVNLYMFHGGTTFGFMNGSLDFGKGLIVQTTNYDVDAPVDEYGRRTPKYYAEQKVICAALGKEIENTATDPVLKSFGEARFTGKTTVKPSDVRTSEAITVRSMENFDQGYGYIVYETTAFVGAEGAKLLLPEVHDIAHVYVDGEYLKTVDRADEDKSVFVEKSGERKIQILVENMGRVNYGIRLKDRKGLVGDLNIFDVEYNVYAKLFGYKTYSLELEKLPVIYDGSEEKNAPAFYRYVFNVDKKEDTLLRVDGFTRGVAFINGFNLGRHWTIEHSENKLFIPAPLLKKGENEIVVFDVLANEKAKTVKLSDQ